MTALTSQLQPLLLLLLLVGAQAADVLVGAAWQRTVAPPVTRPPVQPTGTTTETHVPRRTMVYMYCGADPKQGNHSGDAACDERTSLALSHAPSISTIVLGSYLCRLTEFDDEDSASWCDYQANYSTHIAQLKRAGIDVFLNADGAHNFQTLPAVTGSAAVERMIDLALALNATGWAFDLEAKGIPLAAYIAFFTKLKKAFAPHGLQLQYTSGHHFANSLNFTALLPLVDFVFDMSEYSRPARAFPTRWRTVPPDMRHKYVPGGSVNQWTQKETGPALAMFEAAAAKQDGGNGLRTIGLFTINDNVSSWWWKYLDAWIGSGEAVSRRPPTNPRKGHIIEHHEVVMHRPQRRSTFTPLGVYCTSRRGDTLDDPDMFGCAETTPILWQGKLAVVEHHDHFRIRWQAHEGLPRSIAPNNSILTYIPGSQGIGFASAIVVKNKSGSGEALWVFGNNLVSMDGGKPRTQIHVFWSSSPHLTNWSHRMLIQLPGGRHSSNRHHNFMGPPQDHPDLRKPPRVRPGTLPYWTGANTSPTKGMFPNGTAAYFLALEIGNPTAIVQHQGGFTALFAACIQCAVDDDLSQTSEWHILDPYTHVYRKDRTSECPTLRYFDGWFYVLVNWLNVSTKAVPASTHCHSNSKHWHGCLAVHVARSRDLSVWQEPTIDSIPLGLPDGNNTHGPDHHILAGSLLHNIRNETLKAFVKNQTDDVDRSDMDMVTLPIGLGTYVVYWSGNQAEATYPNLPMDNNGAGLVDGTEQEWLAGFFA